MALNFGYSAYPWLDCDRQCEAVLSREKSKQKQTVYCGAIPDDNTNGCDSVKVGFPRLLE